ncbi:hypothetical protein NIES2100_22200 [Calothrix sp. NIES-2100]|nr:hypothetical protein NIES2100_22200 [Calothrix sp. NIES-2100]
MEAAIFCLNYLVYDFLLAIYILFDFPIYRNQAEFLQKLPSNLSLQWRKEIKNYFGSWTAVGGTNPGIQNLKSIDY